MRDNLREGPCVAQEVGAGAVVACLRVNGASGRTMMELAGLDAIPLEDTDELSGCLSHEFVCRREGQGLIEEAEAKGGYQEGVLGYDLRARNEP